MAFKTSLLALALLTGCGTTATITRANAPAIDAKIVRSDKDEVYVETTSGEAMTVPRGEIKDVDHPGNVAATIGALVTAYGVANVAVGLSECDHQGAAYCAGVFTPVSIGLPVMLWGLVTYGSSVSALGKPAAPQRTGRMFVAPTDRFAGQPDTPGLTVGSAF
jgi:hypothetical protein